MTVNGPPGANANDQVAKLSLLVASKNCSLAPVKSVPFQKPEPLLMLTSTPVTPEVSELVPVIAPAAVSLIATAGFVGSESPSPVWPRCSRCRQILRGRSRGDGDGHITRQRSASHRRCRSTASLDVGAVQLVAAM